MRWYTLGCPICVWHHTGHQLITPRVDTVHWELWSVGRGASDRLCYQHVAVKCCSWQCGQAVTLSVGKGGEITTRTGTLAGDYHNDTRWDHQELWKRKCWYKRCKHVYQSINIFNFQHQPNTEHSTNKEYKMLVKGVYYIYYYVCLWLIKWTTNTHVTPFSITFKCLFLEGCFFTCPPIYFYPSILVFTRPNDGWMGLYIKLWSQVVLVRYQVLFDTDRYLNFVRYSILTL